MKKTLLVGFIFNITIFLCHFWILRMGWFAKSRKWHFDGKSYEISPLLFAWFDCDLSNDNFNLAY
jgi:hypothetical protein